MRPFSSCQASGSSVPDHPTIYGGADAEIAVFHKQASVQTPVLFRRCASDVRLALHECINRKDAKGIAKHAESDGTAGHSQATPLRPWRFLCVLCGSHHEII